MNFKCNCCDGIYNSFDVHFTSSCDNKCSHCIDTHFEGLGIKKPNVFEITETIISNWKGYDDVLFLGGEPCLYLEELYNCIKIIKEKTELKVYVTTSVPKICKDKYQTFLKLLDIVDGINLSVQHNNEDIADKIRGVKSKYDRQDFYRNLPNKNKIRINLNLVRPYLYTKDQIINCLIHYDNMKFNEIKLSEIQHGKEHFISFEKTFGIKLQSPFSYGCQTYLDMERIIPNFKTPVLLKRSCFLCEETLKATLVDGLKVLHRIFKRNENKYAVIYENGNLSKGWK